MWLGKIFKLGFDNWRRPIIFFGITALLFIISENCSPAIFSEIGFYILRFGILILFISTIYQLAKRRWQKGILTGLLFCGTIGSLVIYSIFIFFGLGDGFADDLEIPDNILLHLPQGSGYDAIRPDSILNIRRAAVNFELYNSFQPGVYEYDFWIGKIDSGTVYLKAFEITHNYPLTIQGLPETSAVPVYNSTDSIMRFGTKSNFTIYEGDWGKPYAARFEVWYKPIIKGPEIKLFEKNYKIEGWQH